MLYFIRRFIVWVRRARYSRGFGVQSPWAYRFIRYVVNEHYPYYKYEQLDKQVNRIDRRTRKLCKLYFRLSNYQQPHTFVDCYPASSCYKTYVTAGCQKARYYKVTKETTEEKILQIFSNVGEYSIVRVLLIENYRLLIDKALDYLSSTCVLVIENIKRDKEVKAYWAELVSDTRTGISFDLYYCGVLFLNRDMLKQSYVVNF